MIDIRGLTKTYGTTTVVDNVSLTLARGGVTSVIGPNGAGKSTLLGMVARLTNPDAGQVLVDGLDVAHTAGDVLARRLAILRQDNHMTMRLSVRDLVAFGRYPHCKGRPGPQDREHIEAALQQLELHPLADRYLDQLSGGQRQRAFVAMVLAQDTDYILLDEPLNNLDLKHATSMMRLVRHCADTLGKAVVLVLHDINYASCWSDDIVAMRYGRVVLQGPPSEVMRPDALQAVYDVEIAVQAVNGRSLGMYWF
jgi:iron complex transport system ATP-binding protein